MKRKTISIVSMAAMAAVLMPGIPASADVNFTQKMEGDFARYVNVIPEFTQSTVATQEFLGKYIFMCYTDDTSGFTGLIHNTDDYRYRYFDENAVRDQYKLLFGIDMPVYHILSHFGISYSDGKYRIDASNHGEEYYILDSVIEREDGFDVIYTCYVEGEVIINQGKKSQKICSAKYADNANGYILTSLGTYEGVELYLDYEKLSFEQDPVLQNDRVLVPIRKISELLGCEVEWNGNTRTAMIAGQNKIITIKIGSDKMSVIENGKEEIVELDSPATVVNGSTLIPLRAFCEAMGCGVGWNSESRMVFIESPHESNYIGSYLTQDYNNTKGKIQRIAEIIAKDGDKVTFVLSGYDNANSRHYNIDPITVLLKNNTASFVWETDGWSDGGTGTITLYEGSMTQNPYIEFVFNPKSGGFYDGKQIYYMQN